MLPARLWTGDRLYVQMASTLGRSIWLRGSYESALTEILLRTLRPGDTFYDVGANIGYFTVVAARWVGPDGSVHAFEPNPSCAAILRKSTYRNGLQNVVVVNQVAVAAQSGSLYLNVGTDPGFGFTTPQPYASAQAVMATEAVTITAYAKTVRRWPRLIKLDTNGTEYQALRGAEEILRTYKPHVLCEVRYDTFARWGDRPEALFEYMASLGYATIDLSSGQPFASSEFDGGFEDVYFRPLEDCS
jgi:FkbM family methyltransferase